MAPSILKINFTDDVPSVPKGGDPLFCKFPEKLSKAMWKAFQKRATAANLEKKQIRKNLLYHHFINYFKATLKCAWLIEQESL